MTFTVQYALYIDPQSSMTYSLDYCQKFSLDYIVGVAVWLARCLLNFEVSLSYARCLSCKTTTQQIMTDIVFSKH